MTAKTPQKTAKKTVPPVTPGGQFVPGSLAWTAPRGSRVRLDRAATWAVSALESPAEWLKASGASSRAAAALAASLRRTLSQPGGEPRCGSIGARYYTEQVRLIREALEPFAVPGSPWAGLAVEGAAYFLAGLPMSSAARLPPAVQEEITDLLLRSPIYLRARLRYGDTYLTHPWGGERSAVDQGAAAYGFAAYGQPDAYGLPDVDAARAVDEDAKNAGLDLFAETGD